MIDIDTVRRARARAEANPGILVQGVLCRDQHGGFVSTLDPKASCFCTLGLIANEAGIDVIEGQNYAVDDQTAYGKLSVELFGEYHKATIEGIVNTTIELTDDSENALKEVEAVCPRFTPAGLAGFDYMLSRMEGNK